jgi:hypothetical protein
MASNKTNQRTINDVMDGPIPIKCDVCGRVNRFMGKNENRRYFNCTCGHAVVLTGDAASTAKQDWYDEILRRNRLAGGR